MANIHLIIGGARSGKSRLAEQVAKNSNDNIIYIATASPGDNEMAERILHHKEQRPANWRVIESELQLGKVIHNINMLEDSTDTCILVDCLTLWLTNCLCRTTGNESTAITENLGYWLQEKIDFIDAIKQFKGRIILVSNEVGHGIVPMGQLSREFVDQSGWLHQEVAELATQVDFVMAGLPLTMKSPV